MIELNMCSNERIPDVEQYVNNYEKTVIKRSETRDFARFSNTSFNTTTAPLTYSRQLSLRDDWLYELGTLLAFPTISAQPQHRRDIAAAAHWLKEHLTKLGLHHAQVWPGPNGGHPSVYANWLLAPEEPTLLLYGHYDVQPVDPLREWHTPPFQATRVGQNLFMN